MKKKEKTLALLLGGCGCVTVSVLASAAGVYLALRGPDGVYAGDSTIDVVLTSVEGGGEIAAPILVARLDALGVDATASEVSDRRIALTLDGVSDASAAIRAVIPRRELALHLVAEDQTPLVGEYVVAPPGLSVRRTPGQPPAFAGPDPESLAPVLARAEGRSERIAAVECERDESVDDAPCVAYLLESPPGLTNAHVAGAEVMTDTWDGRPAVSLELTSAGAERFADLTAQGVGRKLAIVLDGRIVSAPVIQERISGGRVQITLGTDSPAALLEQAHGLVACLTTEPLPTTWVWEEAR